MDFRDLECFVSTAEELSFTRAASRLFLSQQTLSARISRLEEHYQIKLFERTTPLTLTPAGTFLLQQARTALSLQNSIDFGIQNILANNNTILNIGTIMNRATVIIQRSVPAFQKAFPNVRVRVYEIADADLPSALHSRPIDMLICYNMESTDTSYLPLYTERYYLCISDGLFRSMFTEEEQQQILRQTHVEIQDFVHCPFLASSYSIFLTSIYITCCKERDVPTQIAVESSSILTRLSLCMAGMGFMFLSHSLYQQATSLFKPDLMTTTHFFPIAHEPETMYRSLGVNYLSKNGLTAIEKEFICIAREVCTETSLFSVEKLK